MLIKETKTGPVFALKKNSDLVHNNEINNTLKKFIILTDLYDSRIYYMPAASIMVAEKEQILTNVYTFQRKKDFQERRGAEIKVINKVLLLVLVLG